MPKKLDVVIPPTDKTAEEVAKALFKLPHASAQPQKKDRPAQPKAESEKPHAASSI